MTSPRYYQVTTLHAVVAHAVAGVATFGFARLVDAALVGERLGRTGCFLVTLTVIALVHGYRLLRGRDVWGRIEEGGVSPASSVRNDDQGTPP